MKSKDIDWNDIIKKEARGINNDENFGEVQNIFGNYIRVQRGIIDKETFYIPKDQIENYDGHILKFRLSESDLNKYQNEPFIFDAASNTLENDMNKLKEELNSKE
jgi:hypothetical protein